MSEEYNSTSEFDILEICITIFSTIYNSIFFKTYRNIFFTVYQHLPNGAIIYSISHSAYIILIGEEEISTANRRILQQPDTSQRLHIRLFLQFIFLPSSFCDAIIWQQ